MKPIEIGWAIDNPSAQSVFFSPIKLSSIRSKPISRRAVQACPAISDFEDDLYLLKCPVSIQLRVKRDGDRWDLIVVEGGTRIDQDLLRDFVYLMPSKEWRQENIPTIQFRLPYFFLADEPCRLQQTAPYLSNSFLKYPGIIIGGRFPIDIWPRTLNWAFEWVDIKRDLRLVRGDHLCYVFFERNPFSRKLDLYEMEITPELCEYRKQIAETPRYISNTFSLFDEVKKRRPESLLKRKIK